MKLSYALALSNALSASAIDQLHVGQIPRRVLQQVGDKEPGFAGAEPDGASMSMVLAAGGWHSGSSSSSGASSSSSSHGSKGSKSGSPGSKGSKSGSSKGSKSAMPPSNAELAMMIDELKKQFNETTTVQNEHIEDLKETTALQSDEIDGLSEITSDQGLQLNNVDERVVELEEEIDTLQNETLAQGREIESQAQEIKDLQERVSELEGPLGNFTLFGDGQCGDSQSRKYSFILYGDPYTPRQCADQCLELDDPAGASLVGFEFGDDVDPKVDNCACLFNARTCPRPCVPLPGYNEVANLVDDRVGALSSSSSSDDRPKLLETCYSYDNFVNMPSASPTESPTLSPTVSQAPSRIATNFVYEGIGFCRDSRGRSYDYAEFTVPVTDPRNNKLLVQAECRKICDPFVDESSYPITGFELNYPNGYCSCLFEDGFLDRIGCPPGANRCRTSLSGSGPVDYSSGSGDCFKNENYDGPPSSSSSSSSSSSRRTRRRG